MKNIKKEVLKEIDDLNNYNELQQNYLIAKTKVLIKEKEIIRRTKKFQKDWTGKEWDSPKKLDELLEIQEKWEKELNLYQAESELYKANDQLKEWALNKIKNNEIEGLPEKTRKTFINITELELARIESKLINVALLMK